MITRIKGDALNPLLQKGESCAIIQGVNDANFMNAGFALTVAKRYPKVKEYYHDWFDEILHDEEYYSAPKLILGEIQTIMVKRNTIIINACIQHGIARTTNTKPIRYNSFSDSLKKAATWAKSKGLSIHLPCVGQGLAGGNPDLIEKMMEKDFEGFDVTVYYL